MTWLKALVGLALVWLMFVEGLGVSVRDFKKHNRQGVLLRGFIAVDVLVPVAAWLVILVVRPERPIVGALVLLAACPIAPLALMRISVAGGRREVATELHLALSAWSVVTTPVTLAIFGWAVGFQGQVAPFAVLRQVALALLVPLLAGLAVRARWPETAEKLRRPGGRVALVLLLSVFAVVFVVYAQSLGALSLRSYGAMAAFVIAALLIGHLLGGSAPRERTVFGLEASSRNLGLAFFIASVNEHQNEALPILVPYVVVFFVITTAYLKLAPRLGR